VVRFVCVYCVTVKYYMVRVGMRLFRCKTATAYTCCSCCCLLPCMCVGDILCASIPSQFESYVSNVSLVLTADEAEANGSGDLEMSYYREEDNSGQSDRVYGTLEDSTEG
jgi:hypothetical protein